MRAHHPDNDAVDVLYIIGSGRSGSTLLGSILGSQPAFSNVGEIYNYRHFFDTVAELDRHCSCGAALDRCGFWQQVDALARSRADTRRLDLKHGDTRTLVNHNHAMLSSILELTGGRVIVDSSKRFDRLQMLLGSPRFRVTILHLVRDGRAFAFSAMTSAQKRELPYHSYFYRRLLKWQNKNIGIRLALGGKPGYHLVRYEDFVGNPDGLLERITGWYGERFDAGYLDSIDSTDNHGFSGNKRFINRNSLEIRQDTRYLEQLGTGKWIAGSTLAAAGILMFGYSFRRTRVKS